MDSMVIHLQKSGSDFHLLITVGDNGLDYFVDDFLTWVFKEVDFFEFVWLTFQSFFGFGVDLIMLVVNVLQLYETNSGYLHRVRELTKVCHQSIALLD